MLATAVILCMPVILISPVPLVDFPNHVARAEILARYASTPQFQTEFALAWGPIPNVAVDIILQPLMWWLPPLDAARAFLIIVILTHVFGAHLLGRSIHGRFTWSAIPAAAFVYSSFFLYGFVNYALGVAVFMFAVAHLLAWREQWSGLRWIVQLLLTTAAYFAHLTAFGFVGIVVCAMAVRDLRTRAFRVNRTVLELSTLVPGVLCFALFMQGDGQVGEVIYNSLHGKIAILASVIRSYTLAVDLALAIGILILIAISLRAPRSGFSSILVLPIAILALGALVAPKQLLTSSGLDGRFILPALLLATVSIRAFDGYELVKRLTMVAAVLFLLRVGGIYLSWQELSIDVRSGMALFKEIPIGARVLPLRLRPEGLDATKRDASFTHVVHYAVMERSTVTAGLFAQRGQQPLVYRAPPARELLSMDARSANTIATLQATQYDWLWVSGATPTMQLEYACGEAYRSGPFALMRLSTCSALGR
jgi:hypothetical protein